MRLLNGLTLSLKYDYQLMTLNKRGKNVFAYVDILVDFFDSRYIK